jgi:hypothetical protein
MKTKTIECECTLVIASTGERRPVTVALPIGLALRMQAGARA